MSEKKPYCLIIHPETPKIAVDLISTKCRVKVLKQCPPQREKIIAAVPGAAAILVSGLVSIDIGILDAAGPELKIISVMSSAYDGIDIETLKERNIALGYTPKVASSCIAEFAIGLIIALAQKLSECEKKMKILTLNEWKYGSFPGLCIRSTTVGLIGFGSNAHAIVRHLNGFDIKKFIYWSEDYVSPNEDVRATYVNVDEIVRQSDYIIITCRLTPQTKLLLNDEAFKKMKSNCILINLSKNAIIDRRALYKTLLKNKIAGAALDLYQPDPLLDDIDTQLCRLDNCIVTPQLSWSTSKTIGDTALMAARNVLLGLQEKPLLASVF